MINKDRIKKARYIMDLLAATAATVETADNGKRKQKKRTVSRPGMTRAKGARCIAV